MRMFTILATVLALSTPVRGAEMTPMITVTGEGMIQAAPDMATVNLGVTTEGDTAKAALDANSAALAAVLDRMKAGGIAAKDIQTSGLSINPRYDYNRTSASGQNLITGYIATNGVTVQVLKLADLGAVLDAAVTDGANTLNGVSFGLIDPQPQTDAARKAAVVDAQRKARLYAEAAGVKLGRVLSISEQGGYSPPAPMVAGARMDKAMAVPVEAGQLGVGASVTIVYALGE